MLSLDHIGIEFGGRWLLRDVSYQFKPGERIGLIGRNGAGKSTLLKVITGQQRHTEGQVHRAGKVEVAYFHQDLLSYDTDRSVYEVARDAFETLIEFKAEIDGLLHQIENGSEDAALWDELAHKQALFDTRGGNQMEANIRSVLDGLGFDLPAQERSYRTFSGGWRMRVLLAQMLLRQPDLLLLDEPTNHLDLPSIQWLENYLRGFSGAVVVVSHDRFFLDRMAEQILELTLGSLEVYAGNYSFYQKEKAIRSEQQQRAYENQQKQIAEQERFIERFRSKASKARQVQSKIKQLDKLDKVQAPEEEHVSLDIRFKMKVASGKEVQRLRDIQKAYGKLQVLEHTHGTVMRGDHIGLIGPNGQGKSTLLRILAGTESHEGSCETGYNVFPSFFAQHQLEALNLKHNVFEEVSEAAAGKTDQEVRNLLGSFMFSGEETEKHIEVLSGGEKSRVALAKTLVSEANYLLLDEPTNHLDIPSIQVLIEALNAYEGTFVVVSHDRYFLNAVANKIWYIEDRQLKEYPGTYAEYSYWQEKQAQAPAASPAAAKGEAAESEAAANNKGPSDYQQQKQLRNRLRKLEREQERVEAKVSSLEAQKEALALRMAEPSVAADFEKLSQVQAELAAVQEELEAATEAWEEVLLQIEALEG